jgi:hypothetical protein
VENTRAYETGFIENALINVCSKANKRSLIATQNDPHLDDKMGAAAIAAPFLCALLSIHNMDGLR